MVVLGMAKVFIDSAQLGDVRLLFDSVLNGQQASGESMLALEKLSGVACKLEFEDVSRLLLFYLDFQQTGTYQTLQYCTSPYDCICNQDFFPLIRWSRPEFYTFAQDALGPLISSYLGDRSPLFSCLLYNYLSLSLHNGSDLRSEYGAVFRDVRFQDEYDLLVKYLYAYNTDELDFSRDMSVAFTCSQLLSQRDLDGAQELLNRKWSLSPGSLSLISSESLGLSVHSSIGAWILYLIQAVLLDRLDDALSEEGLFIIQGSELITSVLRAQPHLKLACRLPIVLCETCPAFDSQPFGQLCKWIPPGDLFLEDSEQASVAELVELIRARPSDDGLWLKYAAESAPFVMAFGCRLLDFGTKEGCLMLLPRLIEEARRWCPFSAKLEHMVV